MFFKNKATVHICWRFSVAFQEGMPVQRMSFSTFQTVHPGGIVLDWASPALVDRLGTV